MGTNVEQSFIKQAILGARLSYGNGKNSDSVLEMFELHIGPEDERFLKARLNASAQGENKFLRVIPVSVFNVSRIAKNEGSALSSTSKSSGANRPLLARRCIRLLD